MSGKYNTATGYTADPEIPAPLPENATQEQFDNWVDEMRHYYLSLPDEAFRHSEWSRQRYLMSLPLKSDEQLDANVFAIRITDDDDTESIRSMIFEDTHSEFGMPVFKQDQMQFSYSRLEDEYRQKLNLKAAYDKQEMLRKMRTDIKREYLTRKRQIQHLQMDAAVVFRNAEQSIQKFYSGKTPAPRIIDITAPLVSKVSIPFGEPLDLKAFNPSQAFQEVVKRHDVMFQEAKEQIIRGRREERIEEFKQILVDGMYLRNPAPAAAVAPWKCDNPNCCECNNDADPEDFAIRGKLQTYPDDFDTYTEAQKIIFEKGRHAEREYLRAIDRHDSWAMISFQDDIEEATDLVNRKMFEKLSPEEAYDWRLGPCVGLTWLEWAKERIGEDWTEEVEDNNSEEHLDNNEDIHYQCDDHPEVKQLDDVKIQEPKERPRVTGSSHSHSASASASASTASKTKKSTKARIAKQQRKRNQRASAAAGGKKFVPLVVTENTNHTRAPPVAADGSDDLPKKHERIAGARSEAAARELRKREATKWKSINAAAKQTNARGTTIPNLPCLGAWWRNNPHYDSCSEYDECYDSDW